MRKEAIKQIKFKHCIFSPIRILKRAKELLYLKGVRNRSASRPAGYGAASSLQISHHLEAKSTNLNNELSRTTAPIKNAENQTRAITDNGEKVVTIRSVLNETRGVNNYMQIRQRQRSVQGYRYNRMKMSYRTELRKMETVDEDKPCCFEDDPSDNSNSNLLYLYPRTRNFGVNRRLVMH